MSGVFAYALIDTAFGPMAIVASRRGVTDVLLPGCDRDRLIELVRSRRQGAVCEPGLLAGFGRQLCRYFEGHRVVFDVVVDLSGRTVFSTEVYRACRRVAWGQTVTYGQLAAEVGRPRAARAVGMAMRCNPVPLVVPCHRVLGADGGLCGFSGEGGVEMKRRLLMLEGAL